MPCFQCPWEPHCHALIHLTFGTAIIPHGRISKIRARHGLRNYAGYNYESGQWVPIGDVRPASGAPKGGSHHPPGPFRAVSMSRVRFGPGPCPAPHTHDLRHSRVHETRPTIARPEAPAEEAP